MQCRRCGSSNIRLSRLRPHDLGSLLTLHYPVRCRLCHERRYVSLLEALKVRSAARARRHEPVGTGAVK
jgi:hypothetical protein